MCEDIVSWVTVNHYSVQREILLFYLFMFALPLAVYLVLRLSGKRSSSALAQAPACRAEPIRSFPDYILIPLILCALYLLFFSGKTNRPFDLFHEGEFIVPGSQLQFGVIAFRDIYLQHGIGRNYLMYLLAEPGGAPAISEIRYIQQLLEPLAYLAVFLLGYTAYRRNLLSAAFLVLLVSGYDYWVGFRQGLGLLAIIALILSLQSHSTKRQTAARVWIALSALGCWIALLYSTEIGCYVLGTAGFALLIISFLTRETSHATRPLLTTFGIVNVMLLFIVAAVLGYHGLLGSSWQNLREQISCQDVIWGLPYPSAPVLLHRIGSLAGLADVAELLRSTEFRIWLPIPCLLYAGLLLAFRAAKGESGAIRWQTLLVLYLGAILFFRTALGRSDYGHWIDGSILFWFLAVFIAREHVCSLAALIRQRPRPKLGALWCITIQAGSVGLLLVLAVFSFNPFARSLERLSFSDRTHAMRSLLQPRLRTEQILPVEQQRAFSALKELINRETQPYEAIYDFSNQGGIYYIANRRIGARLYHSAYAATISQQQEVISDLERFQVGLVIWKSGTPFDAIDGIPNELRQPLIAHFIETNFPYLTSAGPYVLRTRKPIAHNATEES